MIVIATTNAAEGAIAAMDVLTAGGSALDAVEAGIRLVEANPADHSVGYGGYPNLLGEVELDASIMDGRSLAAGAVGALRNCKHPISIARLVMEHLPHVFLVGRGAERFAAEMGIDPCDLLTAEAASAWKQRLLEHLSEDALGKLTERSDLWRLVEIAADPERANGTVNLIAQDVRGDICAGVSTSGWAWKYPGRLGDSPVIGAGIYADNRYGAATCTGMGEMAIRAGTARSVVLYLKMGQRLAAAGRQAMEDLNDLGGPYLSRMGFIALDRGGNHAGFSNAKDGTYYAMTGDLREPVELPRTYVQTKERWGKEGSPA